MPCPPLHVGATTPISVPPGTCQVGAAACPPLMEARPLLLILSLLAFIKVELQLALLSTEVQPFLLFLSLLVLIKLEL